jgi:hypothetical protein
MATPIELSVGEVKVKELVVNYLAFSPRLYAMLRSRADLGHEVDELPRRIDAKCS